MGRLIPLFRLRHHEGDAVVRLDDDDGNDSKFLFSSSNTAESDAIALRLLDIFFSCIHHLHRFLFTMQSLSLRLTFSTPSPSISLVMQPLSRRWISRMGSSSPTAVGWRVSSDSNGDRETKPKRQVLPRNIILLRHGHSLGNQDESLFGRMPDWKIPLSEKGKVQARAAGKRIQEIIGPSSPVLFYVSPYKRTKETLEHVQSQLHPRTLEHTLFTREEPRLREQDFGNFQDRELIQQFKKERPKFGRFFYRFPNGGESGADVFDRVSAFCGTFLQDLEQCGEAASESTAVFVTHGITARLFIMKWLHWTVEDFETLHNPNNCAILHLERKDGSAYRLTEESRVIIKAPDNEGIGRALKIGDVLKRKKNKTRASGLSRDERRAFDSLAETAWGI